MSVQHSVNIQLKLSGDQQLKFLEELVSLLHQDNNEPEAPHLPDARPVDSALGNQGQRTDSYPRSDTPPRYALHGRDSVQQLVQTELTSPEVNSEEASLSPSNASGPRFSHMPHPPRYPPPQRSAPHLHRTLRPSIHLKRCPSIDIDPHLYLNEAELMIVSSNSWQSRHTPRELSSVFGAGYGSSLGESGNEAGKDMSKSQYWLESGEYRLQEWLRKKDRECLLKKRKQREIRRREHRRVQAEAARRTEREDEARAAYQEWLQKKRVNKKSLKIQNQPTATITTQANETCYEEQNGTPTKQPDRSLQRRPSGARSFIRKSPVARQPTGVQLAPSKQVQCTPRKSITAIKVVSRAKRVRQARETATKDGTECDESLPEDLQQIAKGLRKMRLQQKDYSKRHVYTGLSVKHKTRSRS